MKKQRNSLSSKNKNTFSELTLWFKKRIKWNSKYLIYLKLVKI